MVELHSGKYTGSIRTAVVQKNELKFRFTINVHFYYYNNIWWFEKRINILYIYIITTKICIKIGLKKKSYNIWWFNICIYNIILT